MAVFIVDPNCNYGSFYADQMHEAEHASHSRLLGPDGKQLQYAAKPRIGFDLTTNNGKETP